MKLIRRCTVLALSLFILAATMRADGPKTPFTLSVVSCRSNESGRSVSTAEKQPDVFYVVLTNISDRPQPVWETWNSWGYQTVFFEVVLPNGKHLSITKKAQDFTKNFPSVFVIPPGGQQVYPVRLDAEWDQGPVFADPATRL